MALDDGVNGRIDFKLRFIDPPIDGMPRKLYPEKEGRTTDGSLWLIALAHLEQVQQKNEENDWKYLDLASDENLNQLTFDTGGYTFLSLDYSESECETNPKRLTFAKYFLFEKVWNPNQNNWYKSNDILKISYSDIPFLIEVTKHKIQKRDHVKQLTVTKPGGINNYGKKKGPKYYEVTSGLYKRLLSKGIINCFLNTMFSHTTSRCQSLPEET